MNADNFEQLKKQAVILNQSIAVDDHVVYRIDEYQNMRATHKISAKNQTIYFFIEQAAQCHLFIQDDGVHNANVDYIIILEQDAQCDMQFILSQAQKLQCVVNVYLQGKRSQVDIRGLYALNKQQHITLQTYQYHQGQHSKSNVMIRGLIKDYAHASYQGLIKIEYGAKHAYAMQENKNIMLSKTAQVVSIPSIEVLQHDVQCYHGAAIAKFDQEELWYLLSKGLDQKEAQKLLMRSFFQSILQNNDQEVMENICKKMI